MFGVKKQIKPSFTGNKLCVETQSTGTYVVSFIDSHSMAFGEV